MATRSERFKKLAEEAREKTNQVLDEEISSLTEMSEKEISLLVPVKADKEKLALLMSIVSESTAENIRAAKLMQNIGDLGEVVVRVLKRTLI